MAVESDATFIARSFSEPEEFGEIYRRHQRSILAYVRRRVSGDIVEDIVSDTFVAAFRIRRRYDLTRSDARPWLVGIAINVIRNTVRREDNAARPLPQQPLLDPTDDLVAALTAREQLLIQVAPHLGRNDLLLLRMLADGYTYAQIASALGSRPGTLRSRVRRLRRRLSDANSKS